jgi:DNA-binding winged helix-turn-helix (wHTH) protein
MLPTYKIGRCVVLPHSRQLLRDGVPLAVGGRAFELLLVLLERRGRLVSKEELYERIWPGLAVEPNNLSVQVWTLRRLLGADWLKTVPRRGYLLVPGHPDAPGEPDARAAPDDGDGPASPSQHDALATNGPAMLARSLWHHPWITICAGTPALRDWWLRETALRFARAADVMAWHVQDWSQVLPRLGRLCERGAVVCLHDVGPAERTRLALQPQIRQQLLAQAGADGDGARGPGRPFRLLVHSAVHLSETQAWPGERVVPLREPMPMPMPMTLPAGAVLSPPPSVAAARLRWQGR